MKSNFSKASKRPPRPAIVRAALLELLAQIRLDGVLADRALERYLRRERQLFSAERRAIGETLFELLRRERFLDWALGFDGALPANTARFDARLAALRVLKGELLGQVVREHGCTPLLADRLSKMPRELPSQLTVFERIALTGSLPDFLVQRLLDDLGAEDALGYAQSISGRAPLILRANTLKTDRGALLGRLHQKGVGARNCARAPLGISVKGWPSVADWDAFKLGLFEIQDEGSQLLAQLVGARPGERVIDACAGAGGKTLALAAQMENRGELWALDIDARRLAELPPRARRAGAHNVQTRTIDDAFSVERNFKRLWRSCDRVLIDAPCSGLGTLRRSVDARYRLRPEDFARYAARQSALLPRFAEFVRPGGRLVYATCSVAREENEAVVAQFLKQSGAFSLLEVASLLPESARDVATPTGYLRTLPHRHDCDGFFGAVMVRRG